MTQFLGLTVQEGMLLTIGQVSDLVELEQERRGLKRGDED